MLDNIKSLCDAQMANEKDQELDSMLQVMQRLKEDGAAQIQNADGQIVALKAGLRCCHSSVKLSIKRQRAPT